jgi:hypothetical protein
MGAATRPGIRRKPARVHIEMAYIDLSRRFRDLTQAELASPEILASLNDHRSSAWGFEEISADGWTELLRYPRVVLLAEAGSGKTFEMKELAARLMAEGRPAFFVALESLYREPLKESLSPAEERAFDAWKEGQSTAWFFLDSVDELKLTRGTLDRALSRLAKEIDGFLHRAYVVISCRPHDWRPSSDMATVQAKLPFTPGVELANSDELFLAALSDVEGSRKEQKKVATTGSSPRVVVLLPLSSRQIETLALKLGVADTDAFIGEIRRRDAWNFARRPLDLVELVTVWRANGRLGTRAEQHAVNVAAKLKDHPDRADRGLLSDERARSGAERLALALALTHTRTIRSPEQTLSVERAEGVLDPAEILYDWTEEERQTLLRRALFDPATYGRVRFHHRSVQEHLAARRLFDLRNKGMSARGLRSLLFAERYGEQLVIPSMRAIAAWLALWNDDVRRELMLREPETLLSMGDPESLSIPERGNLLWAFVRHYGEGGWRGLDLDIPLGEVWRLAHSELASVVHELWSAKPTSPDVRTLLLEVIWQGPIEGCAGIAHSVAFDSSLPDTNRIIAIRALVAFKKPQALEEISKSIVHEPKRWPDLIVQSVIADLFPDFLSIAGLIDVIQRTPNRKARISGLAWAIENIIEKVAPLSNIAKELCQDLADIIWRGRYPGQEWHRLKGRYNHLAPALARLCSRQLEELSASPPEKALIWACVVANRFGDHELGSGESTGKLKKHFAAGSSLREAAFWSEVKLLSEAAPSKDAKDQYFRAEYRSIIEQLTVDDWNWLLDALLHSKSEHCLVAFHALAALWIRSDREAGKLNELLTAVQEDVGLTKLLLEVSTAEPSPDERRWRRNERRQRLVREGRERQRRESWLRWKDRLVAAPKAAFTAGEVAATTRYLYHWLSAYKGSGASTSFNAWDVNALRSAFGEEVTARAADAFQAVWRAHTPTLWSQRPAQERNSGFWVWHEGLTGLAAEAATPGWATRLGPAEARVAAVYATIELNGFTHWLSDLAAAHPAVVVEVIGGELTAELATATEHSHLPALQNLTYADANIKRLLAPRLVSVLPSWPSTFQDEECSRRLAHYLGQVLGILRDVLGGEEAAALATVCKSQYSADPSGPFSLIWLRSLFSLDGEVATHMLEYGLASLPEQERASRAVATFANLFGSGNAVLSFTNNKARVASLGRLIRCAYRCVRPSEDNEHEGAYTPDARDRAETGRNFLLGTLLDTSGAEAQQAIIDLAVDPIFAHFPDRLRLLARRRAASDAERVALRPEEVLALEKQSEIPPHDRDGLFSIMLYRLDDLAHDLAHDDFTDRRTLRKIRDESEMQVTLARRLRDMAKGAYIVSREDEVADLKRTDIRLAAVRGEQKAVIEVKIADQRWSLTDLEQALRNQLLGRYLRHDKCRAGCLLLTYDGAKQYWKHPKKGRLNFPNMIEHLRCLALSIEGEMSLEVRITVFPLDLTDPPIKA